MNKKLLSPAAIDILFLYYENADFIANLSKIKNQTGFAFSTTKKAIDVLTAAGVLTELDIGKSRAIQLNKESKVAKLIFELFDELKDDEEEKGKNI